MKIKLLATADAPIYSIVDEAINGIDLSPLEYGGEFVGDDETRAAGIRDAERDVSGELHVTLCQAVGPGHWAESDWIDASNYDPNAIYAAYLDKRHAGTPWAITARGKVDPRTNEVINV